VDKTNIRSKEKKERKGLERGAKKDPKGGELSRAEEKGIEEDYSQSYSGGRGGQQLASLGRFYKKKIKIFTARSRGKNT